MVERIVQFFRRKRVSEVHDTRYEPTPAGTGLQAQRFIYLSFAPQASELRGVAMQLCQEIGPDARLQVEIVDILGDEKS
jgi:hypothetical protein